MSWIAFIIGLIIGMMIVASMIEDEKQKFHNERKAWNNQIDNLQNIHEQQKAELIRKMNALRKDLDDYERRESARAREIARRKK